MPDLKLAAACGLYCGACEYLNKQCQGCGHIAGKPFWTTAFKMDVCPLYDCCVNNKQLEHCGLCDEFPCDTFVTLRDPSLNEAEADKALQQRQDDLLKRKEIGTEKWLSSIIHKF